MIKDRRKYATFMVFKAVKCNKLTRPDTCSRCGEKSLPGKDGRATIQAHHHRGYDDEHILDVVWLCPSCHKIVHPNDPESLKRAGAARAGRKRSEASRKKQSETTRDYTPEQRGWTPERREAQRQRMLEKWSARKGRG